MKRKIIGILFSMAMIFVMLPASVAFADTCEHDYKLNEEPATMEENGFYEWKCECGDIESKATIYKIKTVKLNDANYNYAYNGKEKKPNVKVLDSKGNVVASRYYDVVYKNNVNPGKATAVVTFKDRYSGEANVTFKVVPAAPKTLKATVEKKSATLKWENGNSKYSGYQVVYSKYPDFKKGNIYKKVVGGSKASVKLTKLKGDYTYYAKVRAYKMIDEKPCYSKWSKPKKFVISVKRADAKKIKLNQEVKGLTDGSAAEFFKFTAPKTDEYVFAIGNLSDDGYAVFMNGKGREVAYADGYPSANNKIARTVKKGQTIYIKLGIYESIEYEYESEEYGYDWAYLYPTSFKKPTLKITNPDPIILTSKSWNGNGVKMNLNVKTGLLKVTPSVVDKAYSVQYRGGDAIDGVMGKVKTITIGEGVTQIAYPAFSGCNNLKQINLPETLDYIEWNTFSDCSKKVTKLTVPPSVTDLTYAAISKKIKLYGQKDSAVQKYAKKNGNKFEAVIKSPVVTIKKDTKSKKPKISWKKIDGASKYEVWRKTGKDGSYVKVATTKNTYLVNKSAKKGKTYFYKVKALHKKDTYKNSFFSKEKKYTFK